MPYSVFCFAIKAGNASLQGVEGIQSGFFTGHGLDAGEVGLQAGVQADGQSALGNVDRPVVANIALGVLVIAQSAQQHHGSARPGA